MILGDIKYVNIEDIPDDIADTIWPRLDKNGGNVLDVNKDSQFGQFLIENGFVFGKDWGWVVVFR